jgi:hypothetical protein
MHVNMYGFMIFYIKKGGLYEIGVSYVGVSVWLSLAVDYLVLTGSCLVG